MPTTPFKDFKWSDESVESWQEIWSGLWRLGMVWEWQRGDAYGRRLGRDGRQWTVFTAVENNWYHGDLDDVAPLPSLAVVKELLRWTDTLIYSVNEGSDKEHLVKQTIALIEDWLDKHGAVNTTAPLL